MKQALLIIDAQQELMDGNEQENEVFRKTELLSTLNTAVQKAIDSNALIVFVRDIDVASGSGEGFEVHNQIKVPQSAILINKAATNAFYGTSLLELLKKRRLAISLSVDVKQNIASIPPLEQQLYKDLTLH